MQKYSVTKWKYDYIFSSLGDCLMKGLGEFRPVNFLVLFGKFQIDITGQCEPLHRNERFALIYQRIFIQMIEIEYTIGNFYNKLRFFGYSVRFYIIQAEVDR